MPKIVVQGRDYPWIDPTTITFREAQIIKKRLGFSLMGLFQNLAGGTFDEEALLGMFVLAKMRTDGDFDLDQVLELSIGDISIQDDAEEMDDESPLDEAVAEVDEQPASETAPKPRQKKSASSSA